MRKGKSQIALEVLKTQFVAVLILAVVLRVLLDSVIRQMDELALQILDIKFLAAGSDIRILVEEPHQVRVYGGNHPVASEVKLTIRNQQRIINVLLDNVCLFFLVSAMCCLDQVLDLIHLLAHIDSVASVSIFPRLYYPHILMHSVLALYLLDDFILLKQSFIFIRRIISFFFLFVKFIILVIVITVLF